MKLFRYEDLTGIKNPNQDGAPYRPEVLSAEQGATSLGGMFGLLGPGTGVPYHFHRQRESILIALSGEATEIVEGREISIKAGDVLFIPAMEKHTTKNQSQSDFRFIEFFTQPPLAADFVGLDQES